MNPISRFWNLIFFNYFDTVVWKGYKRPLEIEDTLVTEDHIKARNCRDLVEEKLDEHMLKKKEPIDNVQRNDIVHAIYKSFGRKFLWAGVLKLINDLAMLASPIMQEVIIRYIQDYKRDSNSVDPNIGYVFVVIFFLLNVIQTIAVNYYFINSMTCGLQVRTSLTTVIYKKILKMNPALFNSGTVVNLVSTDVARMEFVASYLHMIWSGPFQLIAIIALLCRALGAIALIGIAVILLTAPLQSILFKRLNLYRKNVQKITDSRVKQTNEALQSIKLIKCFAWEDLVLKGLQDLRKAELTNVFKLAVLSTITFGIAQVIPTLASVFTYISYFKIIGELEPALIFSSLSLFNLLFTPLLMLPFLFSGIIDARVALNRLSELLRSGELQNYPNTVTEGPNALKMSGSFSWEMLSDNPKPNLKDISLVVPKEQLTVIIGSVGSGKSSLLQSIIGEMRSIDGKVETQGSIGYCPQLAWIMNGSLKSNVLFGLEYNEARYLEAIKYSQLNSDLLQLPDGDATEIGEKGINLSGGQKQRVSLARAYYFNPKVVLLDDVLSAVDSHVAKALFQELILKAFHGKTTILVTHQLHIVPKCDYVVYMDHGKIVIQGKYEDCLLNDQFKEYMSGTLEDKDVETKSIDVKAVTTTKKAAKLMTAEERFSGAVKWAVYWTYLRAGYGVLVGSMLLFVYVVLNADKVMSNLWLAWYSQREFNISDDLFIIIYLVLGISQGIFVVGTGVVGAIGSYKSSKILHENALQRVLNAPMSFFDTNPLGRILNRFSKDQDSMDSQLPQSFRSFLTTFFATIFGFIYMIYVTPFLAIPLAIMLVFYYFAQDFYRCTSRELKRIDSISKSPVYSLISESISGLSTIRAFREQSRFRNLLDSHVDTNNRPAYSQLVAQRWLSLRLETIGAILIFFAALFGVIGKATIPIGVIALSLTYALGTTGTLNWCVRQASELEVYMNSVERINFYAEELPTEKSKALPNDPENWPNKGEINFQDMKMAYRPGLPNVLKGINLKIEGGERIGVVGRTGSGKSSLMIALLRLVEFEGIIEIDGIDISQIGLHALRRKIAIVPQDPVLFSGTIRSNLDRYNQYQELELWQVLERVGMKTTIMALELKLDTLCEENGQNFSVGERQLF